MEAARFMIGSAGKTGTVQTVGFFISNGTHANKNGDAKASFRIKIYDVELNGSPGKELTTDIIIVAAEQNNRWFDVDVFRYRISIPQKGFYVSFSLLNNTYYKVKAGYNVYSPQVITPRLGLIKSTFQENVSYLRSNDGVFGHEWIKQPFDMNYMIRATIKTD